ncbi:gamma-glutamylcyclotransferase family protein [Maritalea porphyrae]|uniref:gamma-glutamylcyclotransferase family protein n=2 Tax=Maritalea TaxID=623276 RepID=UPI0022AFE1E8|nr:gamma-glutamylcyclotransferase family protein [Maritalea porphyrae]MCZ4273542.1 gamma-glutamylcyclotransferase [Maritalea porphyrae]
MSSFYYFAYGSNLLNARLQNRCASAKPVAIASVSGHAINYGMVADDDHGASGKMAMFRTENGNDQVHGVVYEMAISEAPVLDKFEGLDWDRPMKYTREPNLLVETPTGEKLQTVTYMVEPHPNPPHPYHWYWALCLSGAIENGLPLHHQEMLAQHPYMPDPHEVREGKLEAEMLLNKSGFGHLIEKTGA